jgi:hypothetical protein
MHFFLTLTTLATTSLSLALPQDGGGGAPPFPSNTSAWWYSVSGWPNVPGFCQDNVANGTLQEGVCHCFDYASVGVFQAPKNNCTLTVYLGSDVCGSDAVEFIVSICVFWLVGGWKLLLICVR